MKVPYADSEHGRLRDVLLCAPHLASGKGASSPYADPQRARRQHEQLQRAFEDAGVRCHFLPTSPLTPYQ